MKLILVQSGNAAPEIAGSGDIARPLSGKGIVQAGKLARALGNYAVTRVFYSPARRAMQTAETVFPGIFRTEVRTLYEPPNPNDRAAFDAAFKELGDISLRQYIQHDKTGWVARWGEAVAADFGREFACLSQHPKQCVAIVGHAVVLNILGMGLATDLSRQFMDRVFQEGDAVVIPERELKVLPYA